MVLYNRERTKENVIAISTRDKLEERLRRTPTPSDITFEEFVLFLKHNGFSEQTGRSGHYVYGCNFGSRTYLIAFAKPHGPTKYMKRNYIRKAIDVIDGMKSRSEME